MSIFVIAQRLSKNQLLKSFRIAFPRPSFSDGERFPFSLFAKFTELGAMVAIWTNQLAARFAVGMTPCYKWRIAASPFRLDPATTIC